MDAPSSSATGNDKRWFAMRDLKRPNAKSRAYSQLAEMGFEVFTPLHWVVETVNGKRTRSHVPCIPDLLFVRASRDSLDPAVARNATLQYRYQRGAQASPMVVRDTDMDRFIKAVANAGGDTRFFLPEELTPAMTGRRIRIIGGPLDTYEGNLLYVRGSRIKRLLVELPGFLTAAVEVDPDYIQFL